MINNKSREYIIKKTLLLERAFSMNNYDGDSKIDYGYKYEKGTIPVLVSAPHSVNHWRNGKVKYADIFTGSIARMLHLLTGCHVFYKTKNDNYDPNYDPACGDGGYKNSLIEIIRKENICIFIDLHGAAENREFDIDLGTDYSKTLWGNDFIPDLFWVIFNRYGIPKVEENKVFTASPQNNVSRTMAEVCRIPSIQMEVNRKYREVSENQEEFVSFMKGLCSIISMLNTYEWDSDTYIFEAKKSKKHLPIDKIEFSREDAEKYGFKKNDSFQVNSILDNCSKTEFVARYKIIDNKQNFLPGKVYLTNKLYRDIFGDADAEETKYVLVNRKKAIMLPIGIPKVGSENILICPDLIDKVDLTKSYQLYNRHDDIDFYLEGLAVARDTTAKGKIFLNYYQRHIMNVNIPKKVILKNDFLKYLESGVLNESEKETLRRSYKDKHSYYEIMETMIEDEDLRSIFKKLDLDKIELVELNSIDNKARAMGFKARADRIIYRILSGPIKTKSVYLRVGRPYPTDENSDIVRIMPATMKILGISETDKLIVRHRGHEVILRALPFDSFEVLKSSNVLVYDDVDASTLIGIPAKYRVALGMYSLNSIVTVERDMKYLFIKNSNVQLLPIIAVIFTIIQTFQDTAARILLSCILVPLAIYVSLSQERLKVDSDSNASSIKENTMRELKSK
ncbi:MAG: hypothetical protein GX301_06630 [Gracilibacteraceae bacterium]|nr:hypothetical protein [Gracilibacteraceae bacterium]